MLGESLLIGVTCRSPKFSFVPPITSRYSSVHAGVFQDNSNIIKYVIHLIIHFLKFLGKSFWDTRAIFYEFGNYFQLWK